MSDAASVTDAEPSTQVPQTAPPAPSGSPAGARGRRALVVGASSGMGAAVVRQLAREGYAVAALARRADKLEELARSCEGQPGRVLSVEHDVTDFEAVPELFERLVRELGGLDLYVFAAGIMPEVGPAEYDSEKDLEMLRVNVGGCIAWTNEVARLFASQRSGTVIGIASIAGVRGRKGNPAYGTTKAAVTHYLESLRNRLGESGVHVCTIQPGFIDTAMTRGKKVFWLISPEEAARQMLGAARNRVNTRYVPLRWGLVAFALRLIPSFLFRRMSF